MTAGARDTATVLRAGSVLASAGLAASLRWRPPAGPVTATGLVGGRWLWVAVFACAAAFTAGGWFRRRAGRFNVVIAVGCAAVYAMYGAAGVFAAWYGTGGWQVPALCAAVFGGYVEMAKEADRGTEWEF